jgi:hypothetical protein
MTRAFAKNHFRLCRQVAAGRVEPDKREDVIMRQTSRGRRPAAANDLLAEFSQQNDTVCVSACDLIRNAPAV